MTVYNVNLGIGWASSGVEYAQKYRNDIFKRINIDAKFIFSDLILANNIEALTHNMGFDDQEIIWLYNFFTDVKIAPCSYTLNKLEKDLDLNNKEHTKTFVNQQVVYELKNEQLTIVVRLADKRKEILDQVTYMRNNKLLKRDFYSYTKYACEYYVGTADNYVVNREFYNENGSVAYTQYLDKGKEMFEFPNQIIFYSKSDLYREMLKRLNLGQNDQIIIDRIDEDKNLINGQIILENHGAAKIFVVVHADHYSKEFTNQHHILWNNYYEYQFNNSSEIDTYIVATPMQKKILAKQLKQYYGINARIICIPVGNLAKLTAPDPQLKRYSLITASRLASEKHIDWIIQAVVKAKKMIPELSFDIYGEGNKKAALQELINTNQAQDYIKLKGQQDLSKVYSKYDGYIAASTSEGFGLSLMEAVGSGLPMIGYDVPYGNPTFIDNNKNGFLLPYNNDWSSDKKISILSEAIVKLFTKDNHEMVEFRKHSYEIAQNYLLDKIATKWQKELEPNND
ncbi:accessory Sec system glycosylation protein GtfA [Lactobacillus colini]|uniref:UDP-N-acetylglucosamine--peptide N-acetylglucosaminyltransferase GtfA subunit n=1 Tax=Lactobacillus colini TaxID=1819254 RepID=A0ABS4MGP4_9LACO|nr:accessory Sec system glycosyltransferase GtfA [Lactobacillus colini]MBP2058870.1 accessory Sec system glycosylation protein GtfA [Lactobacillus colini]